MNEAIHKIGHKVLAPIRRIQSKNLKREGKRNRNRTQRMKKHNAVVFIVNYPQGWNSFKKVYEELKKIDSCKVMLIGYENDRYPNSTELFWKSIDHDAIIARDGSVPSIDSLLVDVVFRQTPYDDEYPEEYSARNLSKIAKLCYIPYGYQMSKEIHLQSEYNDWFFPFLTAIYACNDYTYKYCIDKARSYSSTKDIKVFNYGYPRFELLQQSNNKAVKRFLWIPRWSVDDLNNNGTSFFKYYRLLFEFFSNNRSLSLVIRPHPLMFYNFVRLKLMTEGEVDQFKRMVEESPNIILDDSSDYLQTFNQVDAMIADYSTLIVEFFISGKPIIYCGDTDGFNEDLSKMVSLMYVADNWVDVEKNIGKLSDGKDTGYHDRRIYINSFYVGSNSISKRIVDSCLNEI